jgi:hypothetical protein
MLIRSEDLGRIRERRVTLAFRRWRRPSARSNGTLLTPIGLLHIESVSKMSEDQITDDDARAAGYPSRGGLLAELNERQEGDIYRIVFGEIEPDPRIELREAVPDDSEVGALLMKLDRLDRASSGGPWTETILELLAAAPGIRAATLANRVGVETAAFKRDVRKLKALGLTVSLERGYRLSPRGERVLQVVRNTPR